MLEEEYQSVVHCGPDVVAIKAGQHRVHAEGDCTSDAFRPYSCAKCGARFYLGNHKAFPPQRPPEHYYAGLQAMLDADHSADMEHRDAYSIDNP